jgi:phosphinothricin acetyltransferase
VNIAIDHLDRADWEAVREIYLVGIASGNASIETEPPEWEYLDRSLFVFALLIALDNLLIVGWAALSRTSNRSVYAGVAEVSIYVSAAARGRGVGRALLAALIEEAERNDIWTLQAGIFPENTASLTLHKSCGFREVGVREKLGSLMGIWRDVILLERRSHTVGWSERSIQP